MIKQRFSNIVVCLFLLFIILGTLPAKLRHFDGLLDDGHTISQVTRYAVVTRMIDGDGSLIFPKIYQGITYEDLNFLHMAEFPIYQFLIYLFFQLTGESLLVARTVNIIITAVITVAIYQLGVRYARRSTGLYAALLFNFFPMIVFWSRSVIPDLLAVMALCLALLAAIRIRNESKIGLYFALATVLTVALLTKPFLVAFYPLVLYVLFPNTPKKIIHTMLSLSVPLMAVGVWRIWIFQFPEATWMVTGHQAELLHNYLGYWQFFKETQWHTLFFQRDYFGQLLTIGGGVASIGGLIISVLKPEKSWKQYFLLLWFGCSLAITFIVAAGSYWHDYYLLHWTPFAALSGGLCVDTLTRWYLKKIEHLQKISNLRQQIQTAFLLMSIIGVALLLGVLSYKDYTTTLERVFSIGSTLSTPAHLQDYKVLDQKIPPKARIYTISHSGDPFALSYLRREGFTLDYGIKCNQLDEIFTFIDERKRLAGVSFILVDKTDVEGAACRLPELEQAIRKRYPVFYQSQTMTVFSYPEE